MDQITTYNIPELIAVSSPAQKILWSEIRLLTGERAAIQQLYYLGATAGSRFLTVNARVLYFAYELEFTKNTFAATTTAAGVNIFNAAGATILMPSQPFPVWDATAAALKYTSNALKHENLVFWGILPNSIDYMKFIGFVIRY